jgi:hypothetical protein
MTVTMAAGITALLESVTCPRMALVVSPCAHRPPGTSNTAVIAKRVRWSARRIRRVELDLTADPSRNSGLAQDGLALTWKSGYTIRC